MCVIRKKRNDDVERENQTEEKNPVAERKRDYKCQGREGFDTKSRYRRLLGVGWESSFFFYFSFSQLVTDMSTHGPVVCCVSVMPAIVIWPSAQWDERVFSSCFYFFFCILKNDDIFVDVVVDFTFFIDLLALLQFKKERNIPASGRFNTLAV